MSTLTPVITKTKQPILKLQLKKAPRQPHKKYIFSWAGLEHKKAELQQLAHETVDKYKDLDKVCRENGLDLAGMVMRYIQDPWSASLCP